MELCDCFVQKQIRRVLVLLVPFGLGVAAGTGKSERPPRAKTPQREKPSSGKKSFCFVARESPRLSRARPPQAGAGKSVRAGDINLDGRMDIVFSCENAEGKSGVMWLSATGPLSSDTPWQVHDISGPAGTKFDLVQLLDLDADGDLDVLTCEEPE